MVRLSTILPVHNVAPWIAEQLESILRQDVDLEVIIVDDHSNDDTVTIVAQFADQDRRVRLYRAEAHGGASARNVGLALALGDYVIFADGDDLVPDGAYSALLDAADGADAEVAIGRHLKFSSGATWEPMASRYDVARSAITDIETMPALLANRACWNRAFRTDFLRRESVRFPEVARANDIVPMVQTYLAADRIALVPEVVYLYRERPGVSSMTARAAGAEGILSYLEQESVVAHMIRQTTSSTRSAHAAIVLEADGYAHLRRFLRSEPSGPALESVSLAVRRLLSLMPMQGVEDLKVERCVLWYLLVIGRADAAVRFSKAFDETLLSRSISPELVDVWSEVLRLIGEAGHHASFPMDRNKVLRDGPLVLLANQAEYSDDQVLKYAVSTLNPLLTGDDLGSELLQAVEHTVKEKDHRALRTISALRRLAPLRVDRAQPHLLGLEIGGALPREMVDGVLAWLVLTDSSGEEIRFDIEVEGLRWRSEIIGNAVDGGRHRVTLRVQFELKWIDFPVVTARMPLPPVANGMPLQPLADRMDGWRFLIDRKVLRSRRNRARDVLKSLVRKFVR